jgi:tetratricopeptide (TPR) repeat protein
MLPETVTTGMAEADRLRARLTEIQRRYGNDRIKVHDTEIDLAVAHGLLNAGQVDRAQGLFEKAPRTVDVSLELADIAQKRGDARLAVRVLEQAMAELRGSTREKNTVGFVGTEARVAKAQGAAYDMAGQREDAVSAWKVAQRNWEVLLVQFTRTRDTGNAAEAAMEVARMQYLLGQRPEALERFGEALERSDEHYENFIDAILFLVLQGDVDGALDVYRRALAKPGSAINEEHKVYTSLWILDLTRRAGRPPDPNAEAFLRAIDRRKIHLRPHRVSAWYRLLVRYTLGGLSHEQLLAQADTPGKKAEAYFYQAMRSLAEGKSDEAHALWNRVLETRMFKFFEYEMAARYLRTGAPVRVRPPGGATETI